MKKLIAVLCIAYPLLSIAQKKPGADNKLAGIDAKLQPLLSVWKVAGFAVAVSGIKIKFCTAPKDLDTGDYERKIPVTPNTLFAIGSCSKAFTSSLLGLLRNENKIDFDKSPDALLAGTEFF
jgi:CubicO group peptidase (beta-lactamase class C family)